MDIFGTIVSAVDLVKKVTEYLHDVYTASEDASKILSEVSALEPLLSILHTRMVDPAELNGLSMLLINAGLRKQLDECNASLQSLAEKLEFPKRGDGRLKALAFRMAWPFQKDEVDKHLQKIERTKSLILLTCQASLMKFVSSVESDLENLGINVAGVKSILLDIEEKQRVYENKLESAHANLQALGLGITDELHQLKAHIAEATIQQQALHREYKFMVDEGKLRKHMAWLTPLDFSATQSTILSRITPGTGRWFLNHPEFQSWFSNNSDILWCPGIQGAGKTFIVSAAINYIQDHAATIREVVVLYIFLNYQTELSISEMLRAILKQFGKYGFTENTAEQFLEYQEKEKQPTEDQLRAMLKEEIQSRDRAFLVIDALDECSENVRNQLIRHLRELLPAGLNILVTSRPLPDIEGLFDDCASLTISASSEDMRKYVETRIKDNSLLTRIMTRNPSLQEDVMMTVIQKADSMFLLVKLHLDSLESQSSPNGIRKTLKQLPETLGETYTEALNRISKPHREFAFRVFSWLTYAMRPLSLADLQYALAVNDDNPEVDEDDLDDELFIPSVCAGLVSVDDEFVEEAGSPRVEFVHYTVQEFFNRNTGLLLPPACIATTCLQYMFSKNFVEEAVEDLLDIPFVQYAADYWGDHARPHTTDERIRELIIKLMADDLRVRVNGTLTYDIDGFSSLHLGAAFGLTDIIKELIDNGEDVNCRDGSCPQTPFMISVMFGQLETAKTFLETGKILVNESDADGNTALRLACSGGYTDIVKLLLQQDGIDANDADTQYHYTPLITAILYGHTNIAQLLLQLPELDVNHVDVYGYSALTCAAFTDNEQVTRYILERGGMEINPRIVADSFTPLVFASVHGCTENVRLLLGQPDIDVNCRIDRDGSTPLYLAALNQHVDICLLLLQREDLDVNLAIYETGETALFCAVDLGLQDVVSVMLQMERVDCNVVNKKTGASLIGIALQRGHYAIARLLVDSGRILVLPQSTIPLCLAVVEDNMEEAMKIVESGGELVCSPTFSQEAPALQFALQKGVEVRLVQFFTQLLSRSNNAHFYGDFYTNPILVAAKNGDTRVLGALIESGCFDINGRNFYHGKTGLQVAAETGNTEILSAILGVHDVYVNIEDPYGDTPLIHAVRNGHLHAVEILSKYGKADSMHKNTIGQTALEIAIEMGHTVIADYIVVARKHKRSLFKSIAIAGYASALISSRFARNRFTN